MKDLRIIEDRNLSDIVIVDNSIVAFGFQLDNGVPISSYLEGDKDEEIIYLEAYLEQLFPHSDFR